MIYFICNLKNCKVVFFIFLNKKTLHRDEYHSYPCLTNPWGKYGLVISEKLHTLPFKMV